MVLRMLRQFVKSQLVKNRFPKSQLVKHSITTSTRQMPIPQNQICQNLKSSKIKARQKLNKLSRGKIDKLLKVKVGKLTL